MTYPDYTHGRYKVGAQDEQHKTLACLGLQVDAGGEMSVTLTQDDDLTQYNEWNLNLDGFTIIVRFALKQGLTKGRRARRAFGR